MPVFRLSSATLDFPDPSLAEPDGLLAVGGDLSPQRLLRAYALGIFPWYPENSPILWWSPDPRCVLVPGDLHVPRSLTRTLRRQPFAFSLDQAFDQVIENCAATRRENGTWLLPEMIAAYRLLHSLGLAHSAEAWHEGELAGGVYGLALGRIFFGESMFFRRPDASKAALVHLVRGLEAAGFQLLDCQQETANLRRFGAQGIPRGEFLGRLCAALSRPAKSGSWREGIPPFPTRDCPAAETDMPVC
ncbi:MAG: leucyl/phenylalanyl-tRNA--protein transferase [Desulfovibrio sp.]|jgi:leucyl/phenylalanyl-tRNA--protein transferase|nr:leucyl/phenylalanyl-tRNA--protein transferase [Desulfovibrio sp.]